jgi:hypothetical protein
MDPCKALIKIHICSTCIIINLSFTEGGVVVIVVVVVVVAVDEIEPPVAPV